jgi:hypothetical protein
VAQPIVTKDATRSVNAALRMADLLAGTRP